MQHCYFFEIIFLSNKTKTKVSHIFMLQFCWENTWLVSSLSNSHQNRMVIILYLCLSHSLCSLEYRDFLQNTGKCFYFFCNSSQFVIKEWSSLARFIASEDWTFLDKKVIFIIMALETSFLMKGLQSCVYRLIFIKGFIVNL